MSQIENLFPDMEGAKAIIFDLRGRGIGYKLIL